MNTITVAAAPADGSLILAQASSDDHLIEMWLGKSESEQTQRAYRRAIKRFRGFLNAREVLRLDRVTAVDFIEYQQAFPPKWADATRNQHMAAIKSLWTYACELNYLPFNVPHAVYKLRKPRPVTAERILTEKEMAKVLKGEKNPRAKIFLRFLYGTGVRVSEALDVRWSDFYQRHQRVFLRIEHGKGDQFREIGCPLGLYQDLLAARPVTSGDVDHVFPIAYMTAWRWTKAAFKRINKPGGSPHWTRHAHAVVSHENGADWHAVARQLGHKRASFTMDRYGHFSGNHSSDFIDC